DYLRFVTIFFGVISTSAPHIYNSALPLSPPTSMTHELYKQYAHPFVRIVQGLPLSWDMLSVTTYAGDFCGGAAWSPCGRFIAVTKSEAIEILDAVTLQKIKTLKPPEDVDHGELDFSPDGHTLTKYNQEKLTKWDIQTGIPIGSYPSAGRNY
ncbi:hypothetical protein BJ322DRAFT_992207, partial [Thelephora terrestris]